MGFDMAQSYSQFSSVITAFFRNHTTKVLGFAQVTIGVLAASVGVFPDAWLKWLMMISGLLTAWRGWVNSLPADPESVARDQAGA